MGIRSQRRSADGTLRHPYSALNLRLAFAAFGLVSCAILAVVAFQLDLPALAIVLVVLAVVAAVDVVVIQRRRAARRREQPGVRHSLFE
jgi:uncharacterized membrane protein YqjE